MDSCPHPSRSSPYLGGLRIPISLFPLASTCPFLFLLLSPPLFSLSHTHTHTHTHNRLSRESSSSSPSSLSDASRLRPSLCRLPSSRQI
ncbi:hypothetical protein LY78DRAFT_422788 [Colletotrichum sublineola]|nr:hypothetical protein LY78DRAFT_422788 [Colletotrichum sublineola]